MKRRAFNNTLIKGGLALSLPLLGCKESPHSPSIKETVPAIRLSLAQWSLHRSIRNDGMDPFMFASQAKQLGFEGVEYVNQLYNDFLAQYDALEGMKKWVSKSKAASSSAGIENVLIMIDGEGDLGTQENELRIENVEKHFKWVDVAIELGCQSIRVNLFGDGSRSAQLDAASDSMRRIAEYAATSQLNILAENHGAFSSDPSWMVQVMKNVNMDNVGLLPDFGNFCIEREGGQRWGGACINEYPDKYKAIEMMMPYAKAISAKSFAFDSNGKETSTDFVRMVDIAKSNNYQGFIGVEFEGEGEEKEGIVKTKKLLEQCLGS